MSGCGSARMLYKDMFSVEPNLWGGMLPADARRYDAAARECAGAADRGRRAGVGSGALPAGSTRRLERDRRLVGRRHDQRLARGAAPDGAVRRRTSATSPSASRSPGTSVKLDTLNDRLMYRMAYRNFGDHQAIVVNHSVDVGRGGPCGRSLVRAAEDDREAGRSTSRARTSRTRPSTAGWARPRMDHDGNMAVGFSTSSGTAPNYPSIRYAGRLATDPLGQLSQGESTLIDGHGSQTSTRAAGATTR